MKLNITLDEALRKASPGLRAKMEDSVALIRKAERLSLMYDEEDGLQSFYGIASNNRWLYMVDGTIVGKTGKRWNI